MELIDMLNNNNKEIKNKLEINKELINMFVMDIYNVDYNDLYKRIKYKMCETFNLLKYESHEITDENIIFKFTFLNKMYNVSNVKKTYFEDSEFTEIEIDNNDEFLVDIDDNTFDNCVIFNIGEYMDDTYKPFYDQVMLFTRNEFDKLKEDINNETED